jgi:sugar/nucleoside kinase (ribokinase family)
MTYAEVRDVIAKYAHEMLPRFADGWSRFPRGGNAATIVNYLDDKAQMHYRLGNDDIGRLLAEAGAEIIVRERTDR